MTTYRCDNMRPIVDNEDWFYELGGRYLEPKDAAHIFADRLAKREYGKAGYCHHVRLDTYREDGRSYNYQAFIGKDQPKRYGGGCSGRNIWLTVWIADLD